ncbi:hypothetical protein D3C71_1492630 [compost metagenome]
MDEMLTLYWISKIGYKEFALINKFGCVSFYCSSFCIDFGDNTKVKYVHLPNDFELYIDMQLRKGHKL